jgi:diguanylate cyclase (GGDEF)-like protein
VDLSIDILTCYALTGAGAIIGLGLMGLIQTDQPRMAYALGIFRWAFASLSMMVVVVFVPDDLVSQVLKVLVGFIGVGVALLAWAFRQLNGRRTPPLLGALVALLAGAALWLGALDSDAWFVGTIAVVFSLLSVGMAIDQGLIIMERPRGHFSEVGLMGVALVFSVVWVLVLVHVLNNDGPYPSDWLYAQSWLRPIAGLGFALLPLAVASLAFSTINARLMQQLRARALSDELTGCLSRRGLRELGERMLALQNNQPAQVAVLMLDLDHFKAINDRYGHLIGDQVLCHVTKVVRERLRDDALLARYGGEEFSVLLPVQNALEAHGIAERLRQSVESSPCETKMGPIRCTVSIGVSFHCPTSSLEEDLAKADNRLYAAKRSGRNRVEYASPEC